MKMQHIKIALVLLVLVGVVSYVLLRNDTNNINASVLDSQIDTESTGPINKKTNIQSNLQKRKVENNGEFINPPTYFAEQYNKICNKIDVLSIGSLSGVEDLAKKEKREEQLKALYAVQDKCSLWNEYWGRQDDEEKEAYRKKLKESREMELFFQEARQNRDRSVIDLARSVVSTGGDVSSFSSSVLSYLLSVDRDFKIEIAKRMNVINPAAFVRSLEKNTSNIVGLYGCAVDPELSCKSDSIGLLSLCASYGVACGISYDQHIYESTTVNQYNDLQQIVAIIIKLVTEGYFD